MTHHLHEQSILELAATSGLPDLVSDGTIGPFDSVIDLVDAGFLKGNPIHVEGQVDTFQDLKITRKAREVLQEIQQPAQAQSWTVKFWENVTPFVGNFVAADLPVCCGGFLNRKNEEIDEPLQTTSNRTQRQRAGRREPNSQSLFIVLGSCLVSLSAARLAEGFTSPTL